MSTMNSDKLQKAYQEMVGHIRELMAQEGQGLKEAIKLAEQRLQSWQELTRSEAEKVSQEVREDFDSLAETLRESKETLRQQWQNDAQYAKSKLIDTLAFILERANNGLASLGEVLESRSARDEQPESDESGAADGAQVTDLAPAASHDLVMNTEVALEDEHQEHRQWQSERALWQDEIQIWKKEDQQAQQRLEEIGEGIAQLEQQMDDHALALRAHELVNEDHEAVLAEEGHDDVIHHDIHEDERRSHEEQRQLHEAIKSRHRQAMILLEKLHKVVLEE